MNAAPRCGARTRSGAPCRAPAAAGRARCHKHGGAEDAGGQPGNRNALKHGYYSKGAKAERRVWRRMMEKVGEGLKRWEA